MDYCIECGEPLTTTNDPVEYLVRGERVAVEGLVYEKCSGCAEEYYPAGVANEIQRRANDEYRRRHNLLTGEEIKEIRVGLSLSQSDFENLLGVGPKTVIRWEKGTVIQSTAADRLMKLLRDMPKAHVLLRQYGDVSNMKVSL